MALLLGLSVFLWGGTTENAWADHQLPRHQLSCSPDFPCPEEMHRRIDFWIEVFKGWGKEIAVFHDSNVPERVYLVLDTGSGCGGKARKRVRANIRAIRQSLGTLAADLGAGRKIADRQQHMAAFFSSRDPKEIRRAAKHVRCQSGVRDNFAAGLQRYQRYVSMVDQLLAESNLPKDIRYLPFVESSYNPAAHSRSGAAGMWQIMPATARSLGLELDAAIDERLDPEAATRAAIKYLLEATEKILSTSRVIQPNVRSEELNPFVITSYNYGVNGMRRAIRRHGPDYMTVLNHYKSPAFQVAVKNFYASFLAARHVARNANRYFPEIQPEPFRPDTQLVLDRATSMDRIKTVLGLTEAELKPLNLPLTRFVWNGWRLIPAGYRLILPPREDGWEKPIAQLRALSPEKNIPGAGTYVVRKGDTACGIARALRVSCKELIQANRLGKRAIIRIGQKLTIPRKPVALASTNSSSKSGQSSVWTVRRGQTACGISQQAGVDCKELIRVNQLGRKAKILVGQKLIIPGDDYLVRNPTLTANNQYIVQKGDFACRVADKFKVSCPQLIRLNQLGPQAMIYPGQKLSIPGYETPPTTETAALLAAGTASASSGHAQRQGPAVASSNQLSHLLDTLPDLSVRVGSRNSAPVYYVFVEADETLGHYADWLGVGKPQQLRMLNNLRRGAVLRIGQRLLLPEISADIVSRFERMRTDYHQVLSEKVKENYELEGIITYTLKSGDSLWELSRSQGFPLWLLYRLNPELRATGLSPGQTIKLPRFRES